MLQRKRACCRIKRIDDSLILSAAIEGCAIKFVVTAINDTAIWIVAVCNATGERIEHGDNACGCHFENNPCVICSAADRSTIKRGADCDQSRIWSSAVARSTHKIVQMCDDACSSDLVSTALAIGAVFLR